MSSSTHDATYWNNMQDMQHGGGQGIKRQSSIAIKQQVAGPTNPLDTNYWNNMQDMQHGGGGQATKQSTDTTKQHALDTAAYAIDVLKATGSKEELIYKINNYAKTVEMNDSNRDLFITLKTEGEAAFIQKSFENPHEKGSQMSYSEMRSMYG